MCRASHQDPRTLEQFKSWSISPALLIKKRLGKKGTVHRLVVFTNRHWVILFIWSCWSPLCLDSKPTSGFDSIVCQTVMAYWVMKISHIFFTTFSTLVSIWPRWIAVSSCLPESMSCKKTNVNSLMRLTVQCCHPAGESEWIFKVLEDWVTKWVCTFVLWCWLLWMAPSAT